MKLWDMATYSSKSSTDLFQPQRNMPYQNELEYTLPIHWFQEQGSMGRCIWKSHILLWEVSRRKECACWFEHDDQHACQTKVDATGTELPVSSDVDGFFDHYASDDGPSNENVIDDDHTSDVVQILCKVDLQLLRSMIGSDNVLSLQKVANNLLYEESI